MFDDWQRSIPHLPSGTALLLLILNIFFPSFGTFLMACLGSEFSKDQLIVGLLQFITLFILVGWIWSIWWGILCYSKSNSGNPVLSTG